MRSRLNLVLALSSVLVIAAACGGGQPTTAPTQAAPATQTTTAAPMTDAPMTDAPASEAPAEATVLAEEVGDAGVILVDAESGLTLYYFEMDVKDSGESVCLEGCIAAWPALLIPEGASPVAGDGVDAAKLGTITREDAPGELQVTYDGLPLYFFAQDTAPGDLLGVYDQWIVVPA
jgi:predicted lipoprotein with Yx(FWY)xxD motif